MSARDRISEAACAAFVRDGVLGARLEDIRRDADVSVGALYHHFADKEALHADVWLTALADYQRGFLEVLAASADAQDGVKAIVEYHVRFTVGNRDRAALLRGSRPTRAEALARLRDQNRAFFSQVLAWWRIHARYDAVREMPAELLHALWLGPADTYCGHWLDERARRVPAAVLGELAEAAWSALKGAEPR